MLVSKLWQELVRQVGDGRITDEHIKALLDDPDALIRSNDWSEELLYHAPKGTLIDDVHYLGGKWIVVIKRGEEYFVRYDGEEYGPYGDSEIGGISMVHGKLFYIADNSEGHWVIWGDEKIGPENCFYDVVFDEQGKMLYAAEREPGKYVVVWDGEVIAETPHEITRVHYCDGVPLYSIKRDDGYHVIWHGRADYRLFCERVYNLQDGGGKPLFHVVEDLSSVIYLGDHQLAKYKNMIHDLQFTEAGEVLFWVSAAGGNKIHCGHRMVVLKDTPHHLQWANGKLLYYTLDERGPCIYWGSERIAVQGTPQKLWVKNGKLVHYESRNPDNFLVYDGREYAQPSIIHEPQVVNEQLLYVATDGNRDRVSWANSSSRRYDEVYIYSLEVDEAHIFFAGRIGPRLFLVSHQI